MKTRKKRAFILSEERVFFLFPPDNYNTFNQDNKLIVQVLLKEDIMDFLLKIFNFVLGYSQLTMS